MGDGKWVSDARTADANALRCESDALSAEVLVDRLSEGAALSPAQLSLVAIEIATFSEAAKMHRIMAASFRQLAKAIREAANGRDRYVASDEEVP